MTQSDPTPLFIAERAAGHVEQYRGAAIAQHGQAVVALSQVPPNYSAAATACHRALQFQRQADAIDQLANDAGLWEKA
jgi:hypothetical protein